MFETELKTAIKLAREAGAKILEYYGQAGSELDPKGPGSPLTKADLASEKVILEGLREFGYGVLSEETTDDKSRLTQELVWIVDPMDGTSDFISMTDDFCVMIGLAQKGEAVLGVVYHPPQDRLFYAVKGQGAFMRVGDGEPVRLQVSERKEWSEIRMVVSRNHLSELETRFSQEYGIQTKPIGSVGLKSTIIANAEAELNFNPSNKTWEWDVCAPLIILHEAGGRLTDIQGSEFRFNKDNARNENGYVASNGERHQDCISYISLSIKYQV
jgi:3'(2'), 5'-bisphosphate nucleotidase